MNLNEDFSTEPEKYSDEICAMAMSELHDMLIQPMKDKLTQDQDTVLAIIGLTFKVMAEKATALEKMEQGFQGSLTNENDFNRN